MYTRMIASLAVAGYLLSGSIASAATVHISYQIDANLPVVSSGGVNTGTHAVNTIAAPWSSIFAAGISQPVLPYGGLLGSTTIDAKSTAASTLTIMVSATGLGSPDAPTGLIPFVSGLTVNVMPGTWDATLSTFLDSGNTPFGLSTPLDSQSFAAIGTAVLTSTENAGPGPYSVTHVYHIVADVAGSFLATIALAAIPLPGALVLFGGGLAGLGLLMRRRRRVQPVPA